MRPEHCKSIAEVVGAVGLWEEKPRPLEDDEHDAKLPEAYRLAALRFILPDLLQEAVDLRSSELEECYQRTRDFVMKYACRKGIRRRQIRWTLVRWHRFGATATHITSSSSLSRTIGITACTNGRLSTSPKLILL